MADDGRAGHLADDEHLSVLGYEGKFDRSMSLWANFALGFTYLSPLVGVYSLFAVALSTGGHLVVGSNMWNERLASGGIAQGLQGKTLTPQGRKVIDTFTAEAGTIIRKEISWADLKSAYIKLYAEQLRPLLPGRHYLTLGTDGFGRSDFRSKLREHFEVNRHYIVVAALSALADQGELPRAKVAEAIAKYGINADKTNPLYA